MASPAIHSTSVIYESCVLGKDVKVGPFCYIGPSVKLGDGTALLPHVTILGHTTLGKNCTIYSQAVLGGAAQGEKSVGEEGYLVVGDNVLIRECVTIHTGTPSGGRITRIGNNVQLFAGAHVAHDCRLEDHVIVINGTGLAGHVVVERGAIVAGMAGVHQNCRVGTMAFVGAGSIVTKDVLPYSTVIGDRAKTVGFNVLGLKRAGWEEGRISNLQAAAALLFKNDQAGLHAMAKLDQKWSKDIRGVMEFVKKSNRGICPTKQPVAASKRSNL